MVNKGELRPVGRLWHRMPMEGDIPNCKIAPNNGLFYAKKIYIHQ
jgi:hypothetical protein